MTEPMGNESENMDIARIIVLDSEKTSQWQANCSILIKEALDAKDAAYAELKETNKVLAQQGDKDFHEAKRLEAANAELRKEVERLNDKLTADILYKDLAKRVFGRIFEHGREGQHDLELALMEIIQEREAANLQIAELREAFEKMLSVQFDWEGGESGFGNKLRVIAKDALSKSPSHHTKKSEALSRFKESFVNSCLIKGFIPGEPALFEQTEYGIIVKLYARAIILLKEYEVMRKVVEAARPFATMPGTGGNWKDALIAALDELEKAEGVWQ